MIVLDTHVWLWWTGGLPGLSSRAVAELERAERIGICTISCWEVALLAARRRIELDGEVNTWVGRALARERVISLPLDAEIAVAAAVLDDGLSGDPADRIILATARTHGARLLTKDKQLRAYDRETTLW